ncbi:MAG TPA: glycosyltransferase family 1 protein, partial [Solirubrobacteraceae bacterium]|nr:glycosyltransferase family 1 protein [Solirubrobacteraceae bacterium]
LLARQGIDVLSHSPPPGGPIPVLSWIPDFQHRHLPELFSRSERLLRELEIRRAVARAERVIVSSADALSDLRARAPQARGRVLHFVPAPPPSPDPAQTAALLERLGLERFVHLPNQVWAHKNHAVVVEALGVLRERGRDDVVVACTGDTRDYRDPGLLDELGARAQALGVGDRMRMLGRLPYGEVVALMHAAVALLNPSLFEGWSTTVEEAKSIGKRVVLSDIPVHREQAPPDGRYFDPRDPQGLADALAETWDAFDPAAERRRAARAAAELPARRAAFAAAYRAVVGEVAPC